MNRKTRKTNTLYGALQNELNNRWKNKKLYGIYVSMWEKCDRLHMKMRSGKAKERWFENWDTLFWSVFSCIRSEYEMIRSISTYSVWMLENMDQKNSEYGHFSRSDRSTDLCSSRISSHLNSDWSMQTECRIDKANDVQVMW